MEIPPWRQSKGIPESAAPEDMFSHVLGGLSCLQDLSDAATLVFSAPQTCACSLPISHAVFWEGCAARSTNFPEFQSLWVYY